MHRFARAARKTPATLIPPAAEQAGLLFGLVAVVGCLDQLAKAWAWRHLAAVHINSGGNLLVGPVVSGWFRDRTIGAGFDVLDAALLVTAAMLLVRRHRPPALFVGGALALAGWASNLGDRLGLHFWTAPGSMRGVVDFLPCNGRYWNLADAAIILGTTVFGCALLWHALRAVATRSPRRRHRSRHQPIAGPLPSRSRRGGLLLAPVLIAAAVLAGIGATGYSGRTTPHTLVATAHRGR